MQALWFDAGSGVGIINQGSLQVQRESGPPELLPLPWPVTHYAAVSQHPNLAGQHGHILSSLQTDNMMSTQNLADQHGHILSSLQTTSCQLNISLVNTSTAYHPCKQRIWWKLKISPINAGKSFHLCKQTTQCQLKISLTNRGTSHHCKQTTCCQLKIHWLTYAYLIPANRQHDANSKSHGPTQAHLLIPADNIMQSKNLTDQHRHIFSSLQTT